MTIANVTAGTLIDPVWGNSVADAINAIEPAAGALRYQQTIYYTASGAFVKASYPWLAAVEVEVQGAGGGGGAETCAAGKASGGAGGGAGAWATRLIPVGSLSASETITLGAGGTAGSGPSTDGGNGGSTIAFGITAAGGTGGDTGSDEDATYANALPGNASSTVSGTFDFERRGENGQPPVMPLQRNLGGAGGSSSIGGGGRGANAVTSVGSNGGAGIHGSGGGGGCNRAGTAVNRNGGTGGDGLVIVRLYSGVL